MHDAIDNEMVTSGIAVVIDETMHMDKEGNIYSEKDAFDFKVTHGIKHP